MLFDNLPRSMDKCNFVSMGATSYVYEAAPGIAIKYVVRGRLDEFRHKNNTYDLIEQSNPPPYFMQSFLRLPGVHFMPLMAGSLEARLFSNQIRDFKKQICLQVLRLEPILKIEQWAAELAGAIAWLESLGLVQGDLRPANLLLDKGDHLKLSDFDSSAKIGTQNPGLAPPWTRFLGMEAGKLEGTYGLYGPRSEQFAFGSILYNMTHGFELYEDKGSQSVRLLRNMVFPELSSSRLDVLTLRCWRSDFATLADLATEVALLDGAKFAATETMADAGYMSKMKNFCQNLLQEKFPDIDVERIAETDANVGKAAV